MTAEAIKALVAAQKAMGPALKNASNPHLRSKYADLGSVIDACFDALHANGFAVMQPGGADEFGQYVETVFAHESGADFRSRCYLVIGKQDMQGVGSAWTYARRYGLMAMAGIAPEDDDGEGTKRQPTKQPERIDPGVLRDRLKAGIAGKATLDELIAMWRHEKAIAAVASLPEDMQVEVTTAYNDKFNAMEVGQ
jgi:hypothetical protein